MKKRVQRYILTLSILLLLIVISFYFDKQIVQTISLIRTNYLNDFFIWITRLSSELIIIIVVTILFFAREHKRKWIFPLWITIGLSAMLSFLLKVAVQRARPFQQDIVTTLPQLISSNFNTWNFSFPSFQSMLVFCALPFFNKEYPKFKYIWIIFACLVAFSRVYFGLHFMSDVLVGAILGYTIGFIIVDMDNRKRIWSKVYEKIFYGER